MVKLTLGELDGADHGISCAVVADWGEAHLVGEGDAEVSDHLRHEHAFYWLRCWGVHLGKHALAILEHRGGPDSSDRILDY